MSCSEIEIESLVFGGLTAEERSRAFAHLAGCAECREEHAALVRERRLFAERAQTMESRAEAPAPLPDFDQIMARAARPSPMRRVIDAALVAHTRAKGALGQIALVATASLSLVVIARHHVPAHEAPAASASVSAPRLARPSTPRLAPATPIPQAAVCEETVCRDTRGLDVRIEASVLPAEQVATEECSRQPASVLDRLPPEMSTVCAADGI